MWKVTPSTSGRKSRPLAAETPICGRQAPHWISIHVQMERSKDQVRCFALFLQRVHVAMLIVPATASWKCPVQGSCPGLVYSFRGC